MALVDTSWYIEALVDPDIKRALISIGDKFVVHSCEKIHDVEIEDACGYLSRSGQDDKIPILKELYDTVITGVIRQPKKVEELVDEYKKVAKEGKLLSRAGVKKMIADFHIVAAASIAQKKYIFTKNRKTMSKREAKEVYKIANKRKGYKVPKIITGKVGLLKLACSV